MVSLASSTWTDSGAMVRGTGRRMKGMGGGGEEVRRMKGMGGGEEDEGDGRRRGG